jgi:hypothetical protein
MKRLLVTIALGGAAVFLLGAYFSRSQFWQAVLINSSTSFMALGVGLIFVNIYLERHARRGAVKSLLVLSDQALAQFHNAFLNLGWAKFGRDEWGKIQEEYIHSRGKPTALRQDVREFLYEMAKSNEDLKARLEKLLDTLTELARMVGWDLDARLLQACLDSRISIGRLKDIKYDGSDDSKNSATEHLLDIDIHSGLARYLLMTIAGVSGPE